MAFPTDYRGNWFQVFRVARRSAVSVILYPFETNLDLRALERVQHGPWDESSFWFSLIEGNVDVRPSCFCVKTKNTNMASMLCNLS